MMQFDVKKSKNPNVEHFTENDIQVAYKFAESLYKEFEHFLKAVVIFGSLARKSKAGDIDVMVIVDDVTLTMSKELIETYRIIVEKIINDTSNRLHVTTLKLSSFWEYVKACDPVAVNVLRDGYAVIDTGFFDPMQALLRRGRIKPTPESVYAYFARAPNTLMNSKWHVMQAAMDLYWAVIDSAHAALMHIGEVPPTPEHVPDLLEEKLIKPKLIPYKNADLVRKFYKLQKGITHREIQGITGAEYDVLRKEAETFVDAMKKFLGK